MDFAGNTNATGFENVPDLRIGTLAISSPAAFYYHYYYHYYSQQTIVGGGISS